MNVPCRVLKGTGGSGGAYLLDAAFNPMTQVTGGIGGLLVDNALFDLPTVTLTVNNFDALQAYLLGRKSALDQLAACETCPELGKAARVGLDPEKAEDRGEVAVMILAAFEAAADGGEP